jgi:hypothetical protein
MKKTHGWTYSMMLLAGPAGVMMTADGVRVGLDSKPELAMMEW